MKPHEINEAIGRAIGATPRLSYGVGKDNWVCFTDDSKRVCAEWLAEQVKRKTMYADCVVKEFKDWPKYHADLNAMHQAEETLTEDSCAGYIERLSYILSNLKWPNHIFNASAAQRAEAFLRLKGLWKD